MVNAVVESHVATASAAAGLANRCRFSTSHANPAPGSMRLKIPRIASHRRPTPRNPDSRSHRESCPAGRSTRSSRTALSITNIDEIWWTPAPSAGPIQPLPAT